MSYRAEIPLPSNFKPLNGVQPGPWYAGGYWYMTIYGSFDGGTYRQYVLRWKPGITAERVPLVGETDARGSIGVHDAGAALFSWDGLKLIVQNVDFVPAPLDARVDGLVAQIEALEAANAVLTQRLNEFETALGNVAMGGLSEDDVAWVQAVRALP